MKKKKLFYSTGIKAAISLWDVCKFKLRLGDYDDTNGIRYTYLISCKLFRWEFCRVRYRDQKGKLYRRKIHFGG